MYYIYVLFSHKINKYYTGSTSNLTKRLIHHNLALDRWSKRGIPWTLIYSENLKTKTGALKRENFLKTGKGREFLRAKIAKVVTARV